jgi:hypothetical protein
MFQINNCIKSFDKIIVFIIETKIFNDLFLFNKLKDINYKIFFII